MFCSNLVFGDAVYAAALAMGTNLSDKGDRTIQIITYIYS